MRDTVLTVDRVWAIKEELAGFLVREVIAPTGAYHRELKYDIRDRK
jgi:hypothetical protein